MTLLETSPVLVTGGAGFIGSAVVWGLNQRGHDRILVADVLDHTEKWRNLTPLRFDDYIEADALQGAIGRGLLNHVKLVLHLGAASSTTETDGGYLIRNNTQFTKTLAEWALDRQIRFVYASSAATYGALEGELSDDIDLGRLRPLNMYGYSKHLFDLYAHRRGYLDRIAGLKYFNVFGPNEGHKGDMRSVANKAFHQIRESGCVRLFRSYRADVADGEQRRDFLYVKDAVAMTLYVAERPDVNGLVNIGSGEANTWVQLASAVFDALDAPRRIEYIDMPEAIRGKYQYFTRANLTRLRSSGYATPATPLAAAVRDYVREHLIPGRALGEPSAACP
jgi:ADP-L-glycero-D-manno-heptose 6-epimerase